MSTEGPDRSDTAAEPPRDGRSWVWNHSGRLAGLVLGGLAFAFMVFLAAIGFKPALFLVVLLVAGIATIAIGGRIRGA